MHANSPKCALYMNLMLANGHKSVSDVQSGLQVSIVRVLTFSFTCSWRGLTVLGAVLGLATSSAVGVLAGLLGPLTLFLAVEVCAGMPAQWQCLLQSICKLHDAAKRRNAAPALSDGCF